MVADATNRSTPVNHAPTISALRSDLHVDVHEPCRGEHRAHLIERRGAGRCTRQARRLFCSSTGIARGGHDVAIRQAPTGAQHAERLAQHGGLVGAVESRIGQDHIDDASGDRQVLDLAAGTRRCSRSLACICHEHARPCRRHVDADSRRRAPTRCAAMKQSRSALCARETFGHCSTVAAE